jgi:hypothetical protein
MAHAREIAESQVAAVRDDPLGRLDLLNQLYGNHLPYRRAAVAFMQWQLRRGLLEPENAARPGSPWWRDVNERLLRDTAEAIALPRGGSPSTASVEAARTFIHTPNASNWYRAHNLSIVSAYLELENLAAREGRVERFFINLALMRVMYAHALVAAPKLALGVLGPIAPPLGDPRLGMTAIFLSLSRVLPHLYPLGDDIGPFVEAEHGIGHLLDVGVIQPRVRRLYDWSADELGLPQVRDLLDEDIPAYAWDPADAEHWHPAPSRVARLARMTVSVR